MTRIRDIVVAALMLLVLSPFLLILAVLIRLDSPGPALYRQERVGLHGRPFRIHKFRSMRTGAVGLSVTTVDDPRVTRLGRWLRAAKLDELPQLIDVLLGAMGLVGPRPEVPRYVDLWPPDLRPVILSVRPGITDPATVLLRSEGEILAHSPDPERTYVEELLPLKAQAYVSYVRSRSLVGDIKIMLATFKAIIHPAPSARLPKDLETR